MSVLITTEILGENSVITSVESELDLSAAWIRSGDGLIGFGEYKKIQISKAINPGLHGLVIVDSLIFQNFIAQHQAVKSHGIVDQFLKINGANKLAMRLNQ